MRKTSSLIALAVSGAFVTGAFAQATAPAPAQPSAPAEKMQTMPAPRSTEPDATDTAARPIPVVSMTELKAGANSFTEAQAKDRLVAAGFTVTGTLAKDNDGIWRGSATKAGTTQQVGVDYQGNVGAK